MPAKNGSRPLGFSCPNPECKLEYGSISVEERKDLRYGKQRETPKGRTHESYAKKERSRLKPPEYALENIIRSKSEKKLIESYDSPQFAQYLRAFPEPIRQEILEKVRNEKSSFQTKRILQQKEIENEAEKYSKYNVTEERLDVNSPEYKLIKKIHEINTAPTIIPELLQRGKEDFQETMIIGGGDGKEEVVVIVSWNPIMEIKRYRRVGDLMLNLDLKTHLDFISTVVVTMYPDVANKQLFSTEMRPVMEKAFQLYNKYMSQFNNKKWDYLWFEWFWIVRYSQAEAPKKAIKMLQALDGKKRKISLKQIKNKTKEVLHFLVEFFYYMPLLFTAINEIMRFALKDERLRTVYEILNKKSDGDEAAISKIQNNMLSRKITTSCKKNSNSEENARTMAGQDHDSGDHVIAMVRTGKKRVRVNHYNPNYRKELDEFKKGLSDKPWKRSRCGPFKLSELPLAAVKKLYEDGRLFKI